MRKRGVELLALLLACVFAVSAAQAPTHIEIAFSRLPDERKAMYEYFNGLVNEFYVDVGAFHPVDRSNTRILKSAGWKGINMDGNYKRVRFFYGMNPEDLNLNYAVGNDVDAFVELYVNNNAPSLSTGSKDVVRGQGFDETIKIPTITMAQLCSRYFYKKPVFWNLDVEGLGAIAIRGNNWTDPKCRPQTILAETNEWNERANEGNVKEMLEKEGYTPVTAVGEDTLFIENDSVEFFRRNVEKNQKLLNSGVKIVDFNSTVAKVLPLLPPNDDILSLSYDIFGSSIYLLFAVRGDHLDLDYHRRNSDKIVSDPRRVGRPLLIYNFDPSAASVLLSGNYSVAEKKIDKENWYFVVEFTSEGRQYQAYIFNHAFSPLSTLKVVSRNSAELESQCQTELLKERKSQKQGQEQPPPQVLPQEVDIQKLSNNISEKVSQKISGDVAKIGGDVAKVGGDVAKKIEPELKELREGLKAIQQTQAKELEHSEKILKQIQESTAPNQTHQQPDDKKYYLIVADGLKDSALIIETVTIVVLLALLCRRTGAQRMFQGVRSENEMVESV